MIASNNGGLPHTTYLLASRRDLVPVHFIILLQIVNSVRRHLSAVVTNSSLGYAMPVDQLAQLPRQL